MDGFPAPDLSAVDPAVLRLAKALAEADPEGNEFIGNEVKWVQFATALNPAVTVTEAPITE